MSKEELERFNNDAKAQLGLGGQCENEIRLAICSGHGRQGRVVVERAALRGEVRELLWINEQVATRQLREEARAAGDERRGAPDRDAIRLEARRVVLDRVEIRVQAA